MQSGNITKIVLLILLLFSLGSWGIILDKWLQFRRNIISTEKFLRIFKSSPDFDAVREKINDAKSDPVIRIFMSAYKALKRTGPDSPPKNVNRMMRTFELAIDDAILVESQLLQRRISFLGTCGAVTPFIGLFGTVWGIMNAFQGIGAAGSASIAAVAPGIAEALVATAAGLGAAIPAVIAYNYFLGKIRDQMTFYERFRTNLIASVDTE
ncbi:MotA/TolQ/ExbB proton channel family protein [bacterium]|nr:MotA/TolQ/ExbB proton channel family protein [candidate division CSSED10-310 bacterium]